jgi:hypothetical protein
VGQQGPDQLRNELKADLVGHKGLLVQVPKARHVAEEGHH